MLLSFLINLESRKGRRQLEITVFLRFVMPQNEKVKKSMAQSPSIRRQHAFKETYIGRKLHRKTKFIGRQPLLEGNLCWITTASGRQPQSLNEMLNMLFYSKQGKVIPNKYHISVQIKQSLHQYIASYILSNPAKSNLRRLQLRAFSLGMLILLICPSPYPGLVR